MKRKICTVADFKALDQSQGIFEAIVAVFNNVDRVGDKIMPGAFKETLAEWKASGDPIPIIFAHDWDNLDAHIGEVLEAKEVEKGLYVKGQLEMDEPFAARVWKKMQKRTLKEFSFSYDEIDSAEVKEDGEYVNELHRLDLFEVGPCLKGMNPATELLAVKQANDLKGFKLVMESLNVGPQRVHDLMTELGAKCAECEGSPEDEASNGKSSGKVGPSTLATRVAIELVESGIN